MRFLRVVFLSLALALSVQSNAQILYTTEEQFEMQSAGWEAFGQKSGGTTTLNMTTQDFEDYELNYVPTGSGIAVLVALSLTYLMNRKKK